MVSEVQAKPLVGKRSSFDLSAPPPASPKALKKMVALYDYNPAVNSPNVNSNDELSFKSGEIIYVQGDIHDDGFYDGQLENGKKGLVPSNYLKEAPVVEKEEKPAEPAVVTETKVSSSPLLLFWCGDGLYDFSLSRVQQKAVFLR